MEVHISKAQRTVKDTEVESVRILIEDEFPQCATLGDAVEVHQFDAELLCKALETALPGGTLDRLLVEMLKYRASHFVVSYKE